MAHPFRSLLLIALIIILPLPVNMQAALPLRAANPPGSAAPTAPNAASWYNGLTVHSIILNCLSIIQGWPYYEQGAGMYVGFYADPNNGLPAPNTTYYVHVVIGGLGNSCAGQWAFPDLLLPANTSQDITVGHPVHCYYDGGPITPPFTCPQSLPPSPYHSGWIL